MREQRSAGRSGGSARRRVGRRAFLAGVGAASAALAGCVGVLGRLSGPAAEPVSVLAAGSLQNAFEADLRAAVEPDLRIEAHGSAAAARLVAEGQRDPDVLALADPALFSGLDVGWHVRFATSALVVAVNGATDGGRRVAEAERWFEPLLAGEASLGRTDPDLDPLGYRTLFMLELAADHYGRPDLPDRLLDREQVYPETQLLAGFETGSLDAAVVYRSMAEERGYGYVDLPEAVDLGDPDHAEAYARTSYGLPDGTRVRGGVIEYGATRRRDPPGATEVFSEIVTGEYLPAHGFSVPASYPEYEGDVPDGLG